MRRNLSLTILLMSMTTMLCAHGNEQHVMGTVTNITATAITVKTQDGATVEVFIDPDTKFLRGGQPISAKDVKQGDRIIIHANKKGEKLTATTVAIGKAK